MKVRSARGIVLWSGIGLAIACGSSERHEAAGGSGAAGRAGASDSGSAGRAAPSGAAGTSASGDQAGAANGSGTGPGAAGSSATGGTQGGAGAGAGDAGSSSEAGEDGAGGSDAGNGGMGGRAGSAGACSGGPISLLLLVDTSLSMKELASSGSDPKWVTTRDALLSALDDLPASVNLGILFFPQVTVGQMPCFQETLAVPFAPLDAQQREMCANVLASTELDGLTPTYDAYANAVQQLASLGAQGPKVIVLVTDGIPGFGLGCLGTGIAPYPAWDDLVTMVGAAHDNGIETLAISAPGSTETHEMLQAIASAGAGLGSCTGSPSSDGCFLDMDVSSDIGVWLAESLEPLAETCTP